MPAGGFFVHTEKGLTERYITGRRAAKSNTKSNTGLGSGIGDDRIHYRETINNY
jgi:hypothetical protein